MLSFIRNLKQNSLPQVWHLSVWVALVCYGLPLGQMTILCPDHWQPVQHKNLNIIIKYSGSFPYGHSCRQTSLTTIRLPHTHHRLEGRAAAKLPSIMETGKAPMISNELTSTAEQ